MEVKRSHLQNTTQYNNNGHRVTDGSSRTQVMKKASEVSLTPSQAAGQAKLNERKHPLDALSKLPPRQPTIERRSGLQEVDEEYMKKYIFGKSYPLNSGLNDVNASQNQLLNTPAAGQPSISPSQMVSSNSAAATGFHMQSPQQNLLNQSRSNLTASQIQMQSQAQVAAGAVPMQFQHGNTKNHIDHPSICAQQDFQKQIIQEQSTHAHGHSIQQPGQPTMMTTNHNTVAQTPEPEMCTTCPNCQTTIYLVRGAEMTPDISSQAPNNSGHQVISGTTNLGAVTNSINVE